MQTAFPGQQFFGFGKINDVDSPESFEKSAAKKAYR